MSWRDGSSSVSSTTRPRRSGCRSRNRPNARKPRMTFFDGSVRSTRRTRNSLRPSTICRSSSSTAGLSFSSSNSSGSIPIGWLVTTVRRPSCVTVARAVVDLGAEQLLARAQEVPLPAGGVEADDVVREQALVHRAPQVLRQDVPVVGLRPRNVDEVRHDRVGPALPDQLRGEVQVVVVEEHRRVRLAVDLGGDGGGERLVHGQVAVEPRVVQAEVEVRRVREAPHVVLQEPERRVGDDVVVPVVRVRVVRDETQPVRRAVAGRLLEPVAAVLGRNGAVLVGHRARDPGDVVMRDEAAQRSDEAAAAAKDDALARRRAAVAHRPAVGDDEQLPPSAHQRNLPRCATSRADARRAAR